MPPYYMTVVELLNYYQTIELDTETLYKYGQTE